MIVLFRNFIHRFGPSPATVIVFCAGSVFLVLLSAFYVAPVRSTLYAQESRKVQSVTVAETATPPSLRIRQVAQGFKQPLQVAFSPAFPSSFFVVEQAGRIYKVKGAKKELFIDVSDKINSGRGEEGLLGFTFHPDYTKARSVVGPKPKSSRAPAPLQQLFYLHYTTGRPSYSHVIEASRGQSAKVRVHRRLLRVKQPYRNHNGGAIAFNPRRGPPGAPLKLFVGLGDGGSAGDPLNAGQNRSLLLGKILSIDVNSDIPTSPSGESSFRKGVIELWAWGLRNPWRFSFDRLTGRLYAGDVGQNRYEEINLIRKNANYGWRLKEGYVCYKPPRACKGSQTVLQDPIYAYSHSEGQSVTGGYVYRGKKMRPYYGHYFFADFISSKVWALPLVNRTGLPKYPKQRALLVLRNIGAISSFGEDLSGELYIIAYGKGAIYKIEMK